jgi:transposase-like protein
MASPLSTVVTKYQEELRKLHTIPRASYGNTIVGEGFPNTLFFGFLFADHARGIRFLQDCGLLKREMFCIKCESNMSFCRSAGGIDEYRWKCRKGKRSQRCNRSKSVRYSSWFTRSKLHLVEIMLLTLDILLGTPHETIKLHQPQAKQTLTDWLRFCSEVILDYIETTSEKIGGKVKVVEIDESKFGKRKYHRGHHVEGQWVFGGVERGSGRTFLVAIHDRSEQTVLALIKERIEPETTIISDCWKAYSAIPRAGYHHLTVNNSIQVVNPTTMAQTNTIESTWRHVKVLMNPYNRKSDHSYVLADYMFRKRCEAERGC